MIDCAKIVESMALYSKDLGWSHSKIGAKNSGYFKRWLSSTRYIVADAGRTDTNSTGKSTEFSRKAKEELRNV